MATRVSISKKHRFEIFKRDKFACQYCGSTAPNVILEIDHIVPVSDGGTNDFLNLTTSCADCNRGKSNRQLNDDSVLVRQKAQLDDLQVRREQMEMMFEWRKGLDKLDETSLGMVTDYINSKIVGRTLNENGIASIAPLVKKHKFSEILDAVDLAATRYLEFCGANVDPESIPDFLDKIGGILYNKAKSPIDQKVSHVMAVGRNMFGYWDNRSGAALLNQYVTALKEKGWVDEKIIQDLDTEVIRIVREAGNWSAWRRTIEGWIDDIHSWKEKSETPPAQFTDEEICQCAERLAKAIYNLGPVLTYFGQIFEKFRDENILELANSSTQEYLLAFSNYLSGNSKKQSEVPRFLRFFNDSGLLAMYGPITNYLQFYVSEALDLLLTSIIKEAYVIDEQKLTSGQADIFFARYTAHFKKLLESHTESESA